MQMTSESRDPMLPKIFRVRNRKRETHDTFTLAMEPADGTSPARFLPGQFNMLYAFGTGEVPISVSGDPADRRAFVHTIRAVGVVTNTLCRLKPGETLGLRGPFGTWWPVEEATGSDVILVAGGLGLAPLRPAVHHLLAHRADYGNVVLLYGARTPGDLLFLRELERWRGRFDLQVEVTVDAASGGWRGNVGVVPSLLQRARFDPSHALALVCGPEVMMRFTIFELVQNRRMQPERIFLSMERNMKCGVGFCGHCQLGPYLICRDGPVFRCDALEGWSFTREV